MNLLEIVKTSNENIVLLSEMSIQTRSFININNGLEPFNTSYFPDRKSTIQKHSLEIIEEVRIN